MISIITCFEKPIETITLALYRSLKKNLTGSADYRVYAIAPRPGFEPSADAISAAEELGIVYVAAPLNTEFKYYPLLNKAYACEYVARHYGGDAYLFLDSDTLFLNKMDLTIHAASEIAIRPVDYRNIGISDFRESNGPFWQSMYDFLAIKPNRKVLTATGRRPIFEYFNSGYVYTRKPVLFEIWLKLCLHLMKTGRRPDLGIFFVEQSALSVSISACIETLSILPADINYPMHAHADLLPGFKVETISNIRHVHYHKLFNPSEYRRELIGKAGFGDRQGDVLSFFNLS